jgi:hypothetical protein
VKAGHAGALRGCRCVPLSARSPWGECSQARATGPGCSRDHLTQCAIPCCSTRPFWGPSAPGRSREGSFRASGPRKDSRLIGCPGCQASRSLVEENWNPQVQKKVQRNDIGLEKGKASTAGVKERFRSCFVITCRRQVSASECLPSISPSLAAIRARRVADLFLPSGWTPGLGAAMDWTRLAGSRRRALASGALVGCHWLALGPGAHRTTPLFFISPCAIPFPTSYLTSLPRSRS